MAVTVANVDGTHVGTNVASVSFAFTTSGSNPYLKIGVAGFDASTGDWSPTKTPNAGYVRYNSVDLSRLVQQQDGLGDNVEWWGMVPGSTGSLTVDVLIGASNNIDELAVTAECFNGVNAGTPTAGAQGASGAASTLTVTAGATPAAGDLITDVAYAFNNGPYSVGADQTQRINQAITGSSNVLTSTQPDGVGSVMSWTPDPSNWSTAAVIIKAAGAATRKVIFGRKA